jgi:ParB family chromosome partitioning protein
MQQYALIENIQREDLNPIELAKSYEALIKLHNITHEELSSVINKSRTHITNTLRLLNLSKKVQDALNDKKITAGHAKMLVGLDEENQILMLNSIIGQKLSVREVENIIKSMKKTDVKNDKPVKTALKMNFYDLENRLKNLGIKSAKSSNKLTLTFENQSQIDKFLTLFN